ncbi:MAG TPA: extracellular solute-binding protein [Candidatus Binatia bacterium]|jgi:iron(III) transport system substrate-binding protein
MRRFVTFLAFASYLSLAANIIFAQAASPDRAKLIEEAKKESKVVVYAAYSAADANAFKAAFEKKYPFITFEYFRAGKDKLLARYLTEVKAGQFFPDVYQSSIFPVTTLLQRGLLGKYVSPERAAYSDTLKDKEGYWTAVYLNAMTIAYNTRMVKPDEVPKSYQDLLLPKWKGKMGMDLNKTEWYVAMLQMMGEEKGKKYMEALSKQNIQAREGNTITGQLLVAGEFPLVVSQYPTSVEEYKKLKAPIEWVPLEPHFVYSIVMATTAKQPHPAAGRLFVDFALSEEGQKLMRGLSRIPARKDVLPDPPNLIQGHKLLVLNPASSEDYNRYNNEYHKYFR